MNEAKRRKIAERVARQLPGGALVNLGIGIPTLVPNFIPKGKKVFFHSENGFIGLGPGPKAGEEDSDLINAGGKAATILPGGAFFDSAMSFAIIRGGHVDYTILGALEVDEEGNLANYKIPRKFVPGIGGAMDLATGARNVIIAMEHLNKYGRSKILRNCSLPLTAKREVDIIVTDLAFIRVTKKGLVLEEVSEDATIEEVVAKTEAKLTLAANIGKF